MIHFWTQREILIEMIDLRKIPIIKFSGTRSLKIKDEIYDFQSIKSEEYKEDCDF